jgi:hypothetical protein
MFRSGMAMAVVTYNFIRRQCSHKLCRIEPLMYKRGGGAPWQEMYHTSMKIVCVVSQRLVTVVSM